MSVRKLPERQQAFVTAYLANGGNASAAFRSAYGVSASGVSLSNRAHKVKMLPRVQAALNGAQAQADKALQSAVERYGVTAERVADEMARLAFTRLDQVCTVRRGLDKAGKAAVVLELHPFAEIEGDALSALVKVKRSAGGEVTVELADKLAALNSLARLKGWIADKPAPPANLVMFKVER